jgi:hypothetical protein
LTAYRRVGISKRVWTHCMRQTPHCVKLERGTYLSVLSVENLDLRGPSRSLRRRRIRKGLTYILAHCPADQNESNHPDGSNSLNHTQALQAPSSIATGRTYLNLALHMPYF